MEVGILVGLLRFLAKPVTGSWNRLRFGHRVELSLSWRGPLMYFVGDPIESWRSVQVKVIAARNEEFHIVGGAIELRVGRKWLQLVPFTRVVTAPWQVAKNRSDTLDIDGSTIADAIRQIASDSTGQQRIRIILNDLHRQRAQSQPLITTTEELGRRRIS